MQSSSKMHNSVKMLGLDICFQISILKMHLLSQQGCNLKSATMKFNTAMHMSTVACALKGFMNRVLHGQFSMFLNLSCVSQIYIIFFPLSPI